MIQLRPINKNDIDRITELCQDKSIYDMTLNVPYPYKREHAEYFLNEIIEKSEIECKGIHCAICEVGSEVLIGVIGARKRTKDDYRAEVGYWMGKEYRNKGYMTEALRQMIETIRKQNFARRIFATHNVDNPASGKVMEKAGMEYEGTMRSVKMKQKEYFDSKMYAIINEAYQD